MKIRLIVVVLVMAGFLSAPSCTPIRQPVPFYGGLTNQVAVMSAEVLAKIIGGKSYGVLDTKSMEPTLAIGDYVVVFTDAKYEEIEVGWMVVYQARWLENDHPLVSHWVAAKLGNEFIMDGQNNPSYESSAEFRMGKAEFRGRIVAIYSTRKDQL